MIFVLWHEHEVVAEAILGWGCWCCKTRECSESYFFEREKSDLINILFGCSVIYLDQRG